MFEGMSTDELLERIRELKQMVTKPLVRVVKKTQVRRRSNKVYRYVYYYAQYEVHGKTVTKYIGRKLPEEWLEYEKLKRELRALRCELKRRIRI